jgi:tetratricopeptide (TPR) repeat protein
MGCLTAVPSPLPAQTLDEATRFRLAQGLEQAGEFERAAGLYSELLKAKPEVYAYFDGLQRMYMHLKRYDDAVLLVRGRLAASPADITLLSLLGTIYYRSGREAEALETWDRVIAAYPSSAAAYRAIASTMIENRLLDRAAALYRRGREACHDPALFVMELAQLSVVMMDYRTATEEYIRWLLENPSQIGYVQGRMAAYTGKEEGRSAALEVLLRWNERQTHPRLLELLEWLYMEGRRYEEAFAVARKRDEGTSARGVALIGFGERAFAVKAYDVAARAFREAIGGGLAKERLPGARYWYARALQETGAAADSPGVAAGTLPAPEAVPRYADAVTEFQRITTDYPGSEFSARAHFQIGTIRMDRYFDLEGALASFTAAAEEGKRDASLRWAAVLRSGSVLLARGDTLRARDLFLSAGAASDAQPDQADEATFRLAEIDFFGGRHEQAGLRLETLVVNLQADYANDAIQLQAFLQENALTAPAALVQYGRAEFLARQHRYPEAVQEFTAVVRQFPSALLVDDALLRIASLHEATGRYAEAAATYERLLNEFREKSSVLDKALFRLGTVYETRLHDPTRAIAAYEKLLADHPASVLTSEARQRIRVLRGGTL